MISNYRALRQKARQEGRIKSVLGLAYTDPLKPHNCFRSPELPGLPPLSQTRNLRPTQVVTSWSPHLSRWPTEALFSGLQNHRRW